MTNKKHMNIELGKLKPFSGVLVDEKGKELPVTGDPFFVPDDYLNKNDEASISMKSLHASIKEQKVLTPILVRPSKADDGTYEILSGYRRTKVCEVLAAKDQNFQKIPAIIIDDCDDATASVIITSSNVQRQKISLLETIKSCGRMFRGMKHRGKKNRENERATVEIVAEIMGIKPRKVTMYSQFLELPEYMLQLLGNKMKTADGDLRVPSKSGEILSSVERAKLDVISQAMESDEATYLPIESAKELKQFCKHHDEVTTDDVMRFFKKADQEQEQDTSVKKRRVAISDNMINTYCRDMSDQQFEELVTGLLKEWMASNNGASRASSENDVNGENGANDEGANTANNENVINPADSDTADTADATDIQK